MRTLTQSEFARRNGWSRQYVSKLVRERKLTPEPDGRLDPDAADEELSRTTGYTMHGPNGTSLCDTDRLCQKHDELMHDLWCDYFLAVGALWKELRRGRSKADRKLSKDYLVGTIKDLR